MGTLVVDSISKTFNLSKKQRKIEQTNRKRKIALEGLSFRTKPGEIYGLLGPNGAGKTTALRCISTLIKPDQGDVFIDGFSVREDSLSVRKNIAFLTSELKLDDHFSPNYLYNYFSDLHHVEETVREKRKAYLFNKFGIDRFKEVKIADLSTGMKQKVSIAIALVHDPDFIIFDEPTNGLDVLTAKVVIDYLLELRDQGKTIIISTHILSVVEKLCDRIGIIIDGVLKAEGPSDDIAKAYHAPDLETVFFTLMQASEAEIHV